MVDLPLFIDTKEDILNVMQQLDLTEDEFIKLIKEESEKQEALGNSDTWSTEYAFSVDINTEKKGEWVNAGFTSIPETSEDDVIKKVYNEWYYFENNQLELWYQTMRKIKE